jgi:hypothetical protein
MAVLVLHTMNVNKDYQRRATFEPFPPFGRCFVKGTARDGKGRQRAIGWIIAWHWETPDVDWTCSVIALSRVREVDLWTSWTVTAQLTTLTPNIHHHSQVR